MFNFQSYFSFDQIVSREIQLCHKNTKVGDPLW